MLILFVQCQTITRSAVKVVTSRETISAALSSPLDVLALQVKLGLISQALPCDKKS